MVMVGVDKVGEFVGELEEEDEVGIERVVGGLVKGKVEKGVVEGDG